MTSLVSRHSPQKFHKTNCKVSQQMTSLVSRHSSQKFHKTNCKVSQQRSSRVGFMSMDHKCMNKRKSYYINYSYTQRKSIKSLLVHIHRKSFTTPIAKFRSKGQVTSVDIHRKSFTKLIAKFHSK